MQDKFVESKGSASLEENTRLHPHSLHSLAARLHFGCPLCRVWSEVAASALGTCPHCGESIKLNPFTINADWRPIAEAWKATANDE